MRPHLRVAVLFPALLFVLPVLGQKAADSADDKGEDAKVKASIYKQIASSGRLTCKIVGKPDDPAAPEQLFQAQVESKRPNPEGQKKYKQNFPRIQREFQAAQRRRDKAAYDKAVGEFNELKAGLYENVPVNLTLVFGASTEEKKEEKGKPDKGTKAKSPGNAAPKQLIIRRESLPPKDPENPKVKYTGKELAELKGPGNYIGYKATLNDLENDMTVIVYIDRAKFKPPMATKKKKGEEEPAEEDKPIPITMIVIPKPPPTPAGNPLLGN